MQQGPSMKVSKIAFPTRNLSRIRSRQKRSKDTASAPRHRTKCNSRYSRHELKNRSDIICNKYKVDLALSQTGTNFIADILNVGLGALGGGIGGATAQATSAATGAITGAKNVVTSDIYQKITDIVSNYIDLSRDDEWVIVEHKLKTGGYANAAEVFNDVQNYHNRCSLIQALATAQKESANKKTDADKTVGENNGQEKTQAQKRP